MPSASVATTKKTSSHPTYAEMITEAIGSLKEKTGSSKYAITKYMLQHFDLKDSNEKQINSFIRKSLKHGVEKGELKQVKGVGASGSFRLGDVKHKKKTVAPAAAAVTSAASTKTAKATKATDASTKMVKDRKKAATKSDSTPKKMKTAKSTKSVAKKPAAKKATTTTTKSAKKAT